VSREQIKKDADEALAAFDKGARDQVAMMRLYRSQYNYSKYVRIDNTPEFAEYLGYLDARKLYPGFQPRTFREYVEELLTGKGIKPYAQGRE